MSHYISSFLIDPVVRQARRFSRPSFSASEEQNLYNAQANAATAAGEDRNVLAVATLGDIETIVGDIEAVSTSSLHDLYDGEAPGFGRGAIGTSPLQLEGPSNVELAVPLAQRSEPIREQATYSNQHVPSSSLRSDTSSLTESSRSIMSMDMLPAEGTNQNAHGTHDPHDETIRLNKTLPEDDGMGHLRQRILAIQRTDSSNEIKARLVHGVMTEQHNVCQQSIHDRAHSPASLRSSNRPFTPSSPKSTDSQGQTLSPPTSSSSAGDNPNAFYLTAEDLRPTFYEKPIPPTKDTDADRSSAESDEEPRALGCAHYKRNIKLQCSACNRWYTCRFCHDAAEDHMLNRRETKNMLCMLCGCAQPASEECALCSVRCAWYYCDVCKLWDDDPDPERGIYHCDDCGICRVGKGLGKDFFHCKVPAIRILLLISRKH